MDRCVEAVNRALNRPCNRPWERYANRSPGAAVVGLLAVNPSRQARGLGRTLLQAIAIQLAEAGYRRAVLHALIDNQPGLRLYQSEGWIAVGA
jgi:ribosomal protein S18 acetylase RimI-like enzyme